MSDQNLTEAQRNIKDAIARAPTGEDSGLAGMIATNTYSGENSAQAQQKKREKEAFQKVLNQSVQDQMQAFRDRLDEIDKELKILNVEVKDLGQAIKDVKNGDPENAAQNKTVQSILSQKEKELGRKININSPEFDALLNQAMGLKLKQVGDLSQEKAKINNTISRFEDLPAEKRTVQELKDIKLQEGLTSEDMNVMAAQSLDRGVALEADGVKKEAINELDGLFEDDLPAAKVTISVASEQMPETSLKGSSITAFNNAASGLDNNMVQEHQHHLTHDNSLPSPVTG